MMCGKNTNHQLGYNTLPDDHQSLFKQVEGVPQENRALTVTLTETVTLIGGLLSGKIVLKVACGGSHTVAYVQVRAET